MLEHFDIGNESLGYQGNDFFLAVQFAITKARNNKSGERRLTDMAIDIEQAIAKFVNARVNIRWVNGIGPGSIFTRVNTRQHAMFSKAKKSLEAGYFYNMRDVITEKNFVGFVDAKTGKLGGDYSTITHTMLLNPGLFTSGDVEFAAGVVVHEAGHIYVNALFDGVLTSRSMALDWAYKELINASDKESVKKIIVQTYKASGLDPKDVVKATMDADRQKTFTIMAADITRELMEDDPLECYSYNRGEQMADAFAIRHGAGKAILDARMVKYKRERRIANEKNYRLSAGFIVGGLITLVLPPVGAIILFTTGIATLAVGSDSNKAPDATKVLGNLINEMIQIVKEGNLPPEDKKNLLDDIDEGFKNIKAARAQELEDSTSYGGFVARLVANKDVANEFNERLENLSTNRLFVAAARLSK